MYGKKAYSNESEAGRETIRKCEKVISKLDDNNDDYLKNIKFHIEMPYLRPIIPILEALQKEGIEYYIPPIDEGFAKSNPTVKIYIDRNNYDKYMENVHKQISNADSGIITVHIENSFSKIMLEGTDSPYIGKDDKEDEIQVM